LQSGCITKPRWSPDGRFLAIPAQSGSIGIFDLNAGRVTRTLGPHSGEVTALAWDRKAEFILTGSLDRSMGLWQVESGKRAPFTGSGHSEPVHSVEWTDEEAFAITCSTDRIRALDGYCLRTGWTAEMEEGLNRFTALTAAACSYRTTFLLAVLAESGGVLLLVNLVSADVLECVRMAEPAQCLAWSPEALLLAVGAGQSIWLFHATHAGFEGSPLEITSQAPHVCALAFSSDGTLLASHDAQGLKIWDIKGVRSIAALREDAENLSRRYPRSGIAFHPSKTLLAAVTPGGTAARILDVSA
jgi:WD40 repeat protein